MEQRRNGRTLPFTCYHHIFTNNCSNGAPGISCNRSFVDCKIWRMHVPAMALHEKMERQF